MAADGRGSAGRDACGRRSLGESVATVTTPVGEAIDSATRPIVEAAQPVIAPFGEALEPITNPIDTAIEPVVAVVSPATEPVVGVVDPVIEPVASVMNAAAPPVDIVTAVTGPTVGVLPANVAPAMPPVVGSPIADGFTVTVPIVETPDSAVTELPSVSPVVDGAATGVDLPGVVAMAPSPVVPAIPESGISTGDLVPAMADRAPACRRSRTSSETLSRRSATGSTTRCDGVAGAAGGRWGPRR